jgi:hypothetical protein
MEHCRKIGSALWEFVWCLDKITEESDGIGVVLGGAPVKIKQIANDLARSEHTVRRNLDRLQDGNYVNRTRTPYGFTIRVRNSYKFQIWSRRENVITGRSLPRESVQKRPVSPSNLADLTVKNGRNKEDAVVDATVDAAVEPAAASNTLDPWKVVGRSLPMGSARFQQIAEHYFVTRNGEPLSEAMERAIQRANKTGVKVPPPFFDAKRAVERREAEELASPADAERLELEALPWAKR